MLKKRVIAVVTVLDGWAVQSFGYGRHLPLGSPECLVENLDRWGADEILLSVIDRSRRQLGPDFELLARIGRLGLETPLVYAGGVRSAEDAVRAIQFGADRIAVDSLLRTAPDVVQSMANELGAQAIVASIPVTYEHSFLWQDYVNRRVGPFSSDLLGLINGGAVSEVLLVDWANDGGRTAWEPDYLDAFPAPNVPLIVFGGFVEPHRSRRFLSHERVAAVGVGNALSYGEHAYQRFKEALNIGAVRPPMYMPSNEQFWER